MKSISQKAYFQSSPEKVFAVLDDLGVSGMHMTKSSGMMMGSKLKLHYLTTHRTGLGTKYKWTGTIMGLAMNFTVEVTEWNKGREKTWETVGEPKMIIFSWFRMKMLVDQKFNATEATLTIIYKKPVGWWAKILSFLLANFYCNWCLKKMLKDAERLLFAGH